MHPFNPHAPTEPATMNNSPQRLGAKLVYRVCFSLVVAVAAFHACASEDVKGTGPIGMSATLRLAPALVASERRRADFNDATPSGDARRLADWILDSNNNGRLPFLIVDKRHAVLYAFHSSGRLHGITPVLLGSAVGDDSAPGIGQRALSAIHPSERTTPAGRFVAELDHNLQGVEILWVDYDAAISLHRVITTKPKESRAQRLASLTILDNRISYGCINVPVEFFDKVVVPAFKGTNGIVYVMPEIRSVRDVFGL